MTLLQKSLKGSSRRNFPFRCFFSGVKYALIYLLLAALSLGGYLWVSAGRLGPGFPLDDAWIHQTYARNLAHNGEWAFIPGQPSAGSTGPAWALFLAAGHRLGLGPYLWTYVLGWLVLAGLGFVGARAFGQLCSRGASWQRWAGVLLVFEWHLVWSAASGMETMLFALFCLVLVAALLGAERQPDRGWPYWLGVGLWVGLSVWVRPDGITLLGPALFVVAVPLRRLKTKPGAGLAILLGFMLPFVPYLLFNYHLAGSIWPNTFYAKQAEYAILRTVPLWRRWLAQASLPLIGVGAVLLPGFVVLFWRTWVSRRWAVLATFLWVLGFVSLYAWRLPVTFQYGRYLMPLMPVYFLLGLAGLVSWLRPAAPVMWVRVLSRAGWLIVLVTTLMFWGLGARTYGRDVAFIESEMVTVARWVAENTPDDALVAAHDIGALGYFGDRKIVDLAGLISPEVIPFIRDETRLAAYLDEQGVDVLVTFPGWYPLLSARAPLRFQTDAPLAIEMNYENMAVYDWNFP